MPAPSIDIRLFDLTVYAPQVTDAIMGCVGPATKGPVNELNDFTDEGNFVNTHGRPSARRTYGQRAAIRYLHRGNRLKFVRVAGRNLATASRTLYAADGKTPILILTAASPGSWANDDLRVAVTSNGTASYNVFVYFTGQLVEQYLSVDNGIVVSKINNLSNRVVVALAPGAGITQPAPTINTVTGALDKLAFSGGDDGAFAKTDSIYSSTSGVAGKRFHGKMDTTTGSRVFETILTIGASLAGGTIVRSTVGMPVVPGTFTVRVQTGGGPATYVELSDNEDLSYTPGGAGFGILAPSAGAHLGYIDYRTGAFAVKLVAATMFSTGTVGAIWTRADAESVGATAAGVGDYSGNVSSFPLGVGYYSANRAFISVPISEQVGVHVAGGASSGSATAGLKTLAGWIIPGTVVITPTNATLTPPSTIYDDGFGGFRTGPNGSGLALTGTIDYRTGVWTVTWDASLPASSTISAVYDTMVFDMGGGPVPGGDGTWVADEIIQPSAPAGATVANTDPTGQTITGPIIPATVRIEISATSTGAFECYDDGIGGWLTTRRGQPDADTVTGTINYNTGAWSITLPGGATVTATAVIKAFYVSVFEDQARRALRGPAPETKGSGGTIGGTLYADPDADDNDNNGGSYLDHRTGAFAFSLDISALGGGTQSFDVKDGGTLTAVYAPASLLGFGDGTETVFTGTVGPAPFRRNANRLVGFQGAHAATAGSGDAQVTFAKLGASASEDYWSENVALSTDPDNFLDFRSGEASINWTGAPLNDEAVFVIAEEVVLHIEALYPGDIGNERATLTDGFYVEVGPDATLDDTLKLTVFFGSDVVESFGQAESIDALVLKVNDPTNGSDLVTITATDAASFIPVDVGAAQDCGLGGAFTIADVIGTTVGQTSTGLQMFANDETVPVNWLMIPGQWHAPVITALQTLCEKKARRCMAIIPSPDLASPFEHRDFFDGQLGGGVGGPAVPTVTVPYPPLVAIDSRQLATVVPWVQYFDPYTNESPFEPPDGEMAQLIANTPAPWQPVAGLKRGKVAVTQLRYSASRDDRELIYGPVGAVTEIVNPIVLKVGRGPVLLGQRTAQRAATSTDRINVNWTVNVIMNLLDLAAQDFQFEINDAILWRQVASVLNKTLKPIVARRGLQDAFVVVDGTTTTPDDIDQLKLNAKLFIKPARAVEFITFDLILTPSGADFASVVSG